MDVEQRARKMLAHVYCCDASELSKEEVRAARAVLAYQSAVTPPDGYVVVTRNEAGQAVAVTRQDDDGRILSVIAELGPSAGWAAAADRELVAAELGVAKIDDSTDVAAAKLRELIDWHVSVATDPAVNGGYVLVPVEPTKEMLDAGYGFEDGYPVDPDLYRAMLAARPGVKP
ncbi:hypothetical protein ACS0OT_07120 [Stenotrophomonas maltophilia group sp. RY12688]|uniref:hypothetical protein n=1 Tax=Stenotrophomonas maltophilia group sp. RY12688 TaxID=3454438 RepID=UPI003F99BA12